MKSDKTTMIVLAIVLLALVWNLQSPVFLLYGGVEINATVSNVTEYCWTLAQEDCAKQMVAMLELADSGLLICPEGYYPTQIDCRRAFGIIKVPEKPKIKCYYAQDDICWMEEFDEQCPSQYFISQQACEESLIDLKYSVKKLFGSTKAQIFVGVGLVALLIMVFAFLRRR